MLTNDCDVKRSLLMEIAKRSYGSVYKDIETLKKQMAEKQKLANMLGRIICELELNDVDKAVEHFNIIGTMVQQKEQERIQQVLSKFR